MQTIPHFDTTDPYMTAFIHYLGKGKHGVPVSLDIKNPA